MRYYIIRNGNNYGPYETGTLLQYVNEAKILLNDIATDENGREKITVAEVLRRENMKPQIADSGNVMDQIRNIGQDLIFPMETLKNKTWMQDKRLLMLAAIGLLPSLLMLIELRGKILFYLISLYFSGIWGAFFYYFFKTSQVTLKTTLSVFFLTQTFVFVIWDLMGLPSLNPFYALTDSFFPLTLVGFVLGVGLTEEFGKALPLHILEYKAHEPLIPQTVVFYGLISGIAFGVYEGVQYQTGLNAQLSYDQSFFMNIARLTILPFIHAIWCAIGAYFISFAHLYPKYRKSLYVLSLAVPAILHGLYDTMCGVPMGTIIVLPIMMLSVIMLMTYLKQSSNYQTKLRQ